MADADRCLRIYRSRVIKRRAKCWCNFSLYVCFTRRYHLVVSCDSINVVVIVSTYGICFIFFHAILRTEWVKYSWQMGLILFYIRYKQWMNEVWNVFHRLWNSFQVLLMLLYITLYHIQKAWPTIETTNMSWAILLEYLKRYCTFTWLLVPKWYWTTKAQYNFWYNIIWIQISIHFRKIRSFILK